MTQNSEFPSRRADHIASAEESGANRRYVQGARGPGSKPAARSLCGALPAGDAVHNEHAAPPFSGRKGAIMRPSGEMAACTTSSNATSGAPPAMLMDHSALRPP